eukprot:385080_1
MQLSLTQYPEALIITTITEILGVTHNIILLSFHIYCCTIAKRILNKKHLSKLQISSFVVLTVSIIWSLLTIAKSFSLKPSFLNCQYFICIISTTWMLNRIAVYTFFMERLFSVFKVPKYRFSSQFKRYSRLWLLVYFTLITTIGWITNKHYHVIENNKVVCISKYPFYVLALAAFMDLATITTLHILFTRRLMLLVIDNYSSISTCIETLTSNDPDHITKSVTATDKIVMIRLHNDEEMVVLMKRFTVLSIISFMTTFVILMLLSIFEVSTIWGSIDCCINNWCIILMFKCEDKMFRILCCNGEGVNISDNCLSCCSLNICCPIDLQQSVGKCANPVSEQDETTPTGMTISTEYEMIKTNEFSQQEQSVILVTK